MAVTKKKAKTVAKKEFAYANSYGDLSGPFTKKELVDYLTEESFDGLPSAKGIYRLEKIKAKITPAKIDLT